MDPIQTAALRRASEALRLAMQPAGAPSALSITSIVRSVIAETWHTDTSPERREHVRLCAAAGVAPDSLPRGVARVPGLALRDLTVASGSAGGYLSDTGLGEYVAALQADSAVLRLGALVQPVGRAHSALAIPRGATAAPAYWLSDEASPITEGDPSFGSVAASSKHVAAFVEISRQLLLTAANAEAVIRQELRRAAAKAIDAAALNGSGAAGQPRGIIGSAGVGAFTGGSLNQAALRNGQADLIAANAVINPETLAYVTTPAVAELLSTRQRFTGSDRALWEGSLADGMIEGCRALASTNVPTATMVHGDWSSLGILEFPGGLQIDVDPFSKFDRGLVGIRLIAHVDVALLRPASFSVASSIT